MPFFTETAHLPKRLSRFARFRVTFTPQKIAASELAKMLGHAARARDLSQQAETLRSQFEQAFWCDELSTYALALDGNKQPCRVRTSNAGHCLFAGIATQEHARRVATTLTDETSFSGWGIRTVASSEARYNPMSYHNGSVWPHDNSLIAAGFGQYGLKNRRRWFSRVCWTPVFFWICIAFQNYFAGSRGGLVNLPRSIP